MYKNPIIIACVLALLGAGIAIFSTHKGSFQNMDFLNPYFVATSTEHGQSATSTKSDLVLGERVAPEGMHEYQSAAYHFSLFYPKELTVNEHSEGGGAATITFQNVETAQGFQIFIVPYSESQVSEQRFKQDEPSGVRNNLTNITVDGATAAAFYSTNIALGATREVWVVHDGFLYELTTLKSLDAWLGEIIQTWRFLNT
jgi:hypothetical protein